MSKSVKNTIGEVFSEIADGIKSGNFGSKIKIGITVNGSEHGKDNILNAISIAEDKNSNLEVVPIDISDESLAHEKMEQMLDSNEIQACVTMHYNFPIGVATIGRVVTPTKAKEMIIASTTAASAINRVEAMIRNAILGIITAKSVGIKSPRVGVLNVEGARQVERALTQLKDNGYDFEFGESDRSDGGHLMRGNDLITGAVDVMVTDSLTGNLMMKIFSSYQTGGSYEAFGYGYGPGVQKGYNRNILILSRASGTPVVANALEFAYEIVKNNINEINKEEHRKAEKADLESIISSLKKDKAPKVEVKKVEKEIVTAQINGIDIIELDDAVNVLMSESIYAESGMGCTGPIVLVSDKNLEKSISILQEKGYIAEEKQDC